LTIAIFLVACIPIDKRQYIQVKNNSTQSIYFYMNNHYPDTLLPESNQFVFIVGNGSVKQAWEVSGTLEKEFSRDFPHDTLLIFFFLSSTINNYDWETIRKDYKILERRSYSQSDLEKLNWIINYP